MGKFPTRAIKILGNFIAGICCTETCPLCEIGIDLPTYRPHTGNMNIFRISPPCHPDARLIVETAWEGPAYMQEQVPNGFYCDVPGCYNTWDVDGNPV